MISYGKQSIDQADIEAVIDVMQGDWLTQGPTVEKFENELKSFLGASSGCAVANGTAALHLTGMALGWQPDDIVITSPITFLATANCIVYTGAKPDFADIHPATYTIDPNLVEDKIKAHQSKGGRVKAIIGVDYAGHPCNWKDLREIANRYDLQLINDNCHALGAAYFDDKQYAVKYADAVTQSFHPVKHITTGEGGAVLTNDPKIDEKVRQLRTHGITKDPDQLKQHDGPWYYEMHEPGFNYRITDFQCALGSSQLKKLDRFIDKRRQIASNYDSAFSNFDIFKVPECHSSIRHAYHLYPLQVDFDKTNTTKTRLFEEMKAIGINLQVHYIPLHWQPFYQKNYGFKQGDFPVSENFYHREISLPIYPDLSKDDQGRTIERLLELISG